MRGLASITARYIGRPHAEIGCLDLCHRMLRELGRPVPDAVGGWGVANYRDLVRAQGIRSAQRIMLASFWRIGRGVPVRAALPGDLLVVMHRGGRVFPAVYVGRGTAVASFTRSGVRAFRLDRLNYPVMARRID